MDVEEGKDSNGFNPNQMPSRRSCLLLISPKDESARLVSVPPQRS
jgi:hypothetical protein